MIKSLKCFCDMCDKEISITTGFVNQRVPVVTDREWTEGHSAPLRVDFLELDLCKDCYVKAFNIYSEFGYQGLRWRDES